MTLTCKTHPTYKGKKEPRSSCKDCHLIWLTAEISRLRARHEAILAELQEAQPYHIRLHYGWD